MSCSPDLLKRYFLFVRSASYLRYLKAYVVTLASKFSGHGIFARYQLGQQLSKVSEVTDSILTTNTRSYDETIKFITEQASAQGMIDKSEQKALM